MSEEQIAEDNEWLAQRLANMYSRTYLEEKLEECVSNTIFKRAIDIQIEKGWN